MSNGNVLERFEWSVAGNGYQWTKTEHGLALGPAWVPSRQRLPARRYRVFDRRHAGLFRTFAALEDTPEAVLMFANQYGSLGYPALRNFWNGEPVSIPPPEAEIEMFLRKPGVVFEGKQFERDERYAPFAYELLLGRAGTPAAKWSWSAQIRELANVLRGIKHGLRPAVVINEVLAKTAGPHLEWGQGDRWSLRTHPRSLLGALWLQAALLLSDRKEFRRCAAPGCGREIEISRGFYGARADAKFCSNACRTRNDRRKKKALTLAAEGMPVARIARQLHSSPKMVRNWLSRSTQ